MSDLPALVEDEETGARYLRLSDRRVANTIEAASDVLVDMDDEGNPVGVELLATANPS